MAVDEWMREAEGRAASSSRAGELFFALPEAREATTGELTNDDRVAEQRARGRRKTRAYRERRGAANPYRPYGPRQ